MPTLRINCPDSSPSPGTTLTVTGTTPDCSTTNHQVTFNGVALPTTWTCDGEQFSIKITVPPCVPGASNVLVFSVKQGGASDVCSVQVNCP